MVVSMILSRTEDDGERRGRIGDTLAVFVDVVTSGCI